MNISFIAFSYRLQTEIPCKLALDFGRELQNCFFSQDQKKLLLIICDLVQQSGWEDQGHQVTGTPTRGPGLMGHHGVTPTGCQRNLMDSTEKGSIT